MIKLIDRNQRVTSQTKTSFLHINITPSRSPLSFTFLSPQLPRPYRLSTEFTPIKFSHNAGFFSCCSVKLQNIVKFINLYNKIPDEFFDTDKQFLELYRKKVDKNKDITYDFFENYNIIQNIRIEFPINFEEQHQFVNYSNLDFKHTNPLISKYFSPSCKIKEIVNDLEKKYNINYENTVSLYYRGTDKKTETNLASFGEFYNQLIKIVNINKNIKILIQTDTQQFIDYINTKNLKNIIIIEENKSSCSDKGIHNENTTDDNYDHILNFLSTVLIISRCKYIICSSGNCSIWMMLYRGHGKNIIQFLNNKWFNSIC
jgi:hypothetical protein